MYGISDVIYDIFNNIACTVAALSVQLWALLADFLVLWVSFICSSCSYSGPFYPYLVSDTTNSPHFSLQGLDQSLIMVLAREGWTMSKSKSPTQQN